MRDYGRVSPQFWTGQTGRQIRMFGLETQIVALYLMTCPSSNMIGLFYLPIPTLCHETGLTEKGARKALRNLCAARFCQYDVGLEVVWVYNMAKFQIDEQLDPKDNRCKWIWRELGSYKHTKFFRSFCDRYRENFCLPAIDLSDVPQSLSKAPSQALPSQDHELDHEKEREQNQEAFDPVQMRAVVMPKSALTWQSYSEAYKKRYGIDPVRNKKTNSLLCQLVDRLGADEAPQIAAFYVRHPKPVYVSNRHPVSLLLRDAEGLRTEYFTGLAVSFRPKTVAEQL